MKGQKTLYMIFSMSLIALVILIFTGFIQNSATSIQESQVLDTKVREIKLQCSQVCQEVQAAPEDEKLAKAVEYCTERFSIGKKREEVLGQGYNSYCATGAHCFNFKSCSFKGRVLNAANCREIMCQHFSESSNTGERVQSYFEADRAEGNMGVGYCSLSSIEDSAGYSVKNWWTENFEVSGGDYSDICK